MNEKSCRPAQPHKPFHRHYYINYFNIYCMINKKITSSWFQWQTSPPEHCSLLNTSPFFLKKWIIIITISSSGIDKPFFLTQIFMFRVAPRCLARKIIMASWYHMLYMINGYIPKNFLFQTYFSFIHPHLRTTFMRCLNESLIHCWLIITVRI